MKRQNRKEGAELYQSSKNPAYIPNDRTRRIVFDLCRTGYSQKSISKYVGISIETLQKYYRNTLDKAEIKLLKLATNRIARNLKSPNDKVVQRAAEFVLKTRGRDLGWTDRHEIVNVPQFDLSKLTDEELDMFEELQRKIALNKDGRDSEGSDGEE